MSKLVQVAFYDKIGNVVFSDKNPFPEMIDVVPGTLGESNLNCACSVSEEIMNAAAEEMEKALRSTDGY
jgi:hypothetical protein